MNEQFITVLAYHDTSYRLISINMQHVVTIETMDGFSTQITLRDGRVIVVMGTVADVMPNPGYISPHAAGAFNLEKTRLDGSALTGIPSEYPAEKFPKKNITHT